MPLQFLLFTTLLMVTYYVGSRCLLMLHDDAGMPELQHRALSLPVGFGVFSLLTGPLLVAHAPYQYAVSLVSATAFVLCAVSWKSATPGKRHAKAASADLVSPLESRWNRTFFAALCSAALATAIFAAHEPTRRISGVACVLIGLAIALLAASRIRDTSETESRIDKCSSGNWMKLEWLLAGAFMTLLVATATLCVREDADDVLYLSEALVLQDSVAMAVSSPVHRGENLPTTAIYAWQAFELWGGMLADAAGLPILPAFRTALAPALVVLAVLLYFSLLQQIIPKPLLPIATIALLSYFSFGTTSLFAGNSYFLVRAAQGKTWLIHIGFPALTLATMHFLNRPHPRRLCTLLLVSFACLGFSPTSVFTCPALLFVITVATCITQANQQVVRRSLGMAIATLPFIAFGIYILMQQTDDAVNNMAYENHPGAATWMGANLYYHLGLSHGGGAIELLLLMSAPLMLVTFRPKASLVAQIYPAAITLLLAVTALNPLVFPLLESAIGYNAVSRYLWIVPFPVLAAMLAAGASQSLSSPLRLAAAASIPLIMLAMGGRPIWTSVALPNSTGPAPYLAPNLYKMPNELLAIAEILEQETTGTDRRILCSPRAASHLSPFCRDFHFVYARSFQTEAALAAAGRFDELDRRRMLAIDFLHNQRTPENIQELLQLEQVAFAVLTESKPKVSQALTNAGFRKLQQINDWSAWKSDSDSKRSDQK